MGIQSPDSEYMLHTLECVDEIAVQEVQAKYIDCIIGYLAPNAQGANASFRLAQL